MIYQCTATAQFSGPMQPWMRFYRLDNKWVSTDTEGIQDAIRKYQLDKYYVPAPFGDKLMEFYTTEDQRK